MIFSSTSFTGMFAMIIIVSTKFFVEKMTKNDIVIEILLFLVIEMEETMYRSFKKS